MKRLVSTFLIIALFLLAAPQAQSSENIQAQAIKRAPYLQQTLDAYHYRLTFDKDPMPAIRELATHIERVVPEASKSSVMIELMSHYKAPRAYSLEKDGLCKTDQAGMDIKVNDSNDNCWDVSAALSKKSKLVLAVWQDDRNGVDDPDIYGQFFDADMNPIGDNFDVHAHNGGIAQSHPDVAALSDGGFMVAWEDYRDETSAVYARRFAADRTPVGDEFQVSVAIGSQLKPAVAADGAGRFVITWLQHDDGDYNVYARLFDAIEAEALSEFLVNDDIDAFQWFSDVVMSMGGDALFVWEDKRDGNSNIYAQRLRADGSKRGGNFKVDDSVGDVIQWQPTAAVGPDQFVVTWEDFRDAPNGIYAQWFDASMLADGPNRRVDDLLDTSVKELPSAAINHNGETVFCWQDSRGEAFHIFAQTYNADKSADAFIALAESNDTTEQRFPTLLLENRLVSFFWLNKPETGDHYDIFATQVMWIPVPVEMTLLETRVKGCDVVCSWKTMNETTNLGFAVERSPDGVRFAKIGFVKGRGTSSDETNYAFVDENVAAGEYYYRLKQVDYNGDFGYSNIEKVNIATPEFMQLLSNYPNPFNPMTTISYQLERADHVRIEILDVHGRLITTLVNAPKTPGIHEIVWDARDSRGIFLASGLYFCKLNNSKESFITKMILTK